jgi:hypothetical protein
MLKKFFMQMENDVTDGNVHLHREMKSNKNDKIRVNIKEILNL